MNGQHQIRRKQIGVRGVVQGVGFRPFVYRLALDCALSGSIGNDTEGVTIDIEGTSTQLDAFLGRLQREAPAMARIDAIDAHDAEPLGQRGFRIITSQVLGQVSTGIPPDTATCSDCLRELFDPHDRRFGYPFLNCTNCGPRFTITRSIPYDRPQTSMAAFPMCAQCQAEYDDPLDRRFHAQPNACWDCGPSVWLTDTSGVRLENRNPVQTCIERILAGEIAAVKGIGGFHLCVDATSETAVARLRHRKRRFGKPLAVMVKDLAAAQALCRVTAEDETLLTHPARPIVLMQERAQSSVPAQAGMAPSLHPGVPWLGLFLPYAPLQHLLFADDRVRALVMTSANLSEEPIAIDNDEALQRLRSIADCFLLHDREILQRCDDSVMASVDGGPQIVRRARGFVPLSTPLPFSVPPLLAVGGQLKAVFTLAQRDQAYASHHLGDLESLPALEFFEESLRHLMHTFEIMPEAVVHDLHPGYMSTTWARQWAEQRGLPLIGVQHHHAHIAACMAEHGLRERVIGLSLDGTGYGTDGCIWGGEVLLADYGEFQRFAHLAYVPMPGGDAAVREPWRMALAHLHAAGCEDLASETWKRLEVGETELRVIRQMMDRAVNAPLTSSMGRLFDAAAALILNRRAVDYEAQAAIELEGVCIHEPDEGELYPIELMSGTAAHGPLQIAPAAMWTALLQDLARGESTARMAARFHRSLADAMVRIAELARTSTQLNVVVMSGGVMHNRRLTRLLRAALQRSGFRVLQQRKVSPGDGGLSYGQVAVAAARLVET